MPKQPRNKNIVRQIRERLGWSQQALADRLGVSRRTVQQIEAGKQTLDDETADSLRDYSGVAIPRDEDETSGEKGRWVVELEIEEDFEDGEIDEQEEKFLNTQDRENLNTLADAARGILRLIGLAALRKNVHVHFGRALERYLIRVMKREKLKPFIAAVLLEEYRKRPRSDFDVSADFAELCPLSAGAQLEKGYMHRDAPDSLKLLEAVLRQLLEEDRFDCLEKDRFRRDLEECRRLLKLKSS